MAEEVYAPTFELLVNGRALAPEYRALIRSVVVDATVDGADEVQIDADGWSTIRNTYAILGETVLGPGNELVVRMGWADGELATLQRFRLLREEASYPPAGRPRVTIRGYSAEHRLVEHTDARTYELGTADSDIVRELAAEHGLATPGGAVEDAGAAAAPRVKPKGTSDWKFLAQLATANGFGSPYVRYDEDTDSDVLYWRTTSLADQGELAKFTYDPHVAGSDEVTGSLYDFQPSLSLAGVPTRVEVVGWDPVAQEGIRVTVELVAGGQRSTVQTGDEAGEIPEPIRSGGQLQVAILGDAKNAPETEKREVIEVGTVTTTEDARVYAERWITTRMAAFMVARARTVGFERLWIAQVIELAGVASHHAGKWEVLGCRHRIDSSGYTCELDLSRVLDEMAAPSEV